MKKPLAFLLAMAMLLSLCAFTAYADDVVTITVWSDNAHEKELRVKQVEEFNETIGKENGIFVEYASTKGVRDHLALVEMIRFSMERVWKRHVPDEHGYILSMDFTVDQIFKKIFPFGKLTGRVEEFSHAFNKKKGV